MHQSRQRRIGWLLLPTFPIPGLSDLARLIRRLTLADWVPTGAVPEPAGPRCESCSAKVRSGRFCPTCVRSVVGVGKART